MDRPGSTRESNRDGGASRMPSRDLLLDLARLADLPFTVSWFFLANSKLRERSMKPSGDGVLRPRYQCVGEPSGRK